MTSITSHTFQMEIASLVVLLLCIPWHGPILPRPPCPRDNASLVRKVVTKKWLPILQKVGASLPLECPLHPARDVFNLHDSRKNNLTPQWICGFCGKAYFHEHTLDAHMEVRHSDKLINGEDTICVADFCDVMRCEVLRERLQELEELTPTATALDIWHKPLLRSSKHITNYHRDQAIGKVIPCNVMRSTPRSSWTRDHASDDTNDPDETPELLIHPLHSWKDTCNEEHLAELRVKCQQLVQQCVSGLVLNLTLDQVKNVEVAFHRSICWYLTCERYWEAGNMDLPEFPWGMVSALILSLTFGVSMCYYIVWVLCESVGDSAANTPVTSESPPLVRKVCTASSKVHNHSSTSGPSVTQRIHNSKTNSLGRSASGGASASRARFSATESESECRDSGFNEGSIYPEYESQDLPGGSGRIDVNGDSYRTRHYSDESRLSLPAEEANPRYYVQEERVYNYASTFTPNYEQRRLRRNRYNYLDDFDAYTEIENDNIDSNGGESRERSDSFIYVSYPPEMKKRFQESNR